MRRYPDDYNPILEYWDQITSGEVVVSDKVRRKRGKDFQSPSGNGAWNWIYYRGQKNRGSDA